MFRTIRACAAATVAAVAAISPTVATDRYFRDQTVFSPDRAYRLEARSPDNAGERPKPFARNFTYTLYRGDTKEALWQRRQDEGSPTAVYVDDSGWTVVHASGEELFALEPQHGKRTLRINILEEFPGPERDEHVHWTTAGFMWTSGSRWFFHRHDSRLYFVIRTGWGRFVIVDLQSSTVLRQPLAALVASIEGSGSAWAVETLARACAQLDRYSAQAVPVEGEAPVTPDVSEILSAANVVIAARLHDAVPHLRRLEQSDYIGSAGGWWDIENRYADGEINPFNEQQHTLRRASHTALRQLGERPAELPATSFRYTRPKKLGEVVPVPALPAPRADRVGELRPGMTVPEILAAVGAPDYVNFRETAWEYDMDADDPYTLRVYFKDKKTLDRTERLRPPAWMSGDRTRQIFGGG